MKVNGEPVSTVPIVAASKHAGSYVELKRAWRSGDTVSVTLPKTLRLEALADNPRCAAIMWGPLVLAGDLGPDRDRSRRSQPGEEGGVPVLVAAEKPLADWLKPAGGQPGRFQTAGVGRDKDVNLVPFYQLHRRTYAVYWDLFTPAEWEKKAAEYAAERERLRKLELATVAYAQPGEMQPERDFNQQGEDSSVERVAGRPGRRGRNWFSFDLPVKPAEPMTLVVTYHSGEQRRKRTFEILVNGKRIAEQEVTKSTPARFFDVEYPLPAELLQGKDKVTVRFQATGGNEIATVFGLRIIRAEAKR